MNPTTFVLPQGAWSHGKEIIASNGAILPPYCIKCGRPAEPNFFRKQFSWHQSWVYLFILVAILVYAILAATLSKRMTLRLPLCAKHLEKYRSLKIASALLLLGCLPEMIVAGTLLPEKYMPLGVVAGLLALIAGVVCLALFNGLLQVNRIDDYYGYFSKASEGFLAHLPPAPPGMTLPR